MLHGHGAVCGNTSVTHSVTRYANDCDNLADALDRLTFGG